MLLKKFDNISKQSLWTTFQKVLLDWFMSLISFFISFCRHLHKAHMQTNFIHKLNVFLQIMIERPHTFYSKA